MKIQKSSTTAPIDTTAGNANICLWETLHFWFRELVAAQDEVDLCNYTTFSKFAILGNKIQKDQTSNIWFCSIIKSCKLSCCSIKKSLGSISDAFIVIINEDQSKNISRIGESTLITICDEIMSMFQRLKTKIAWLKNPYNTHKDSFHRDYREV